MRKLLLALLLTPMSAFALFEGRLTYGAMGAKDALTEICTGICTGTVPGMVPLYGMGADVLVKLPLIPFGFGVRYEKLSLSGTTSDMTAEAQFNRTAVLVNYRLIDTILHIGPIFSYGINHSGGIKMTQNSNSLMDYTSNTGESMTLGLEVGVKPLIIIPLKVGAEAGISQAKLKDATDSFGNTNKTIDLSGYYMKLFIGLDL